MRPVPAMMIIGIALGTSAELHAQGSLCPVAGSYLVVGRIPGATGSYTGQATISANGAGCYIRWYPPNDSEGTGSYAGGQLTVHFTFANGGSGVVKYDRAPNGELHGTWWMDANPSSQGTETLRPR